MPHVVIIGNGISGVTAARHIRKRSEYGVTIISSETKHFYARTALMYVYMGHMTYEHTKPYEDWFWKKNRIDLIQDHVIAIDTDQKNLSLETGSTLSYDYLIIATGSKSNAYDWPGQDLAGVQGLYHIQDLEKMEHHTKNIQRAVIVGGGLIGVEMAEMLHSRDIPVTFLSREKYFWNSILPCEEAQLIGSHIRDHGIDLRLESELSEILSDDRGCARAVITKAGESIECQFVGLTVGVSPNISFLKNSGIDTDRGVLINAHFETNIPDVYAIGDCAQFRVPLPGRRSIEQVWYTGKIQGETLGAIITGDRRPYTPGIWFNSAKFFNIEYQTYGMVLSKCPDDEKSFFWKDPKRERCVRINYRKNDRAVTGFNFFGIRARHQVCEQWISEKRTITYVLEHLGALNFDPEFHVSFEKDVIAFASLGKMGLKK